jgi:hypothetical protein
MSSNTNYLQLANCESPKFLYVDEKKCLSSFIAYYFEIRWLSGSLFGYINKKIGKSDSVTLTRQSVPDTPLFFNSRAAAGSIFINCLSISCDAATFICCCRIFASAI